MGQENSGDAWVRAQQEWNEPSNWQGGWLDIYCAPRDPRMMVRKRWSPGGWTFNFAHRASWYWTAVILLGAAAVLAIRIATSA